MTALPAELHERARRQGLDQREGGCWWSGNTQVVWGSDREGWVWCPPWERISHSSVPYPTEAPALRACLDWLDLQEPGKAWRPVPWAPVVAVLKVLRGIRVALNEAPSIAARAEGNQLQIAIWQLEQATLGPNMASTPEQALALLLDLAGDRGGPLGPELLEQLRRVLQARPDEAVQLVSALQIAGPWRDGRRVSVGHASEIDQLQIVVEVREVTGGWSLTVEGEVLGDGESDLNWLDEQAAQAAADDLLNEEGKWALAGGATPAPEGQRRRQLFLEVHAAIDTLTKRCPDATDRIHLAYTSAGGSGWQVATAGEETLARYLVELRALTPPEGARALCLDCDGGRIRACERCSGSGLAVPCPRCRGEGTISWGQGPDVVEGDCPRCSGGPDPEDDFDDDYEGLQS